MKRKSQTNERIKLYKHSLGHYWTKAEAHLAKSEFDKLYNVEFEVVEEKRSQNKHKNWCVCEFYPEEGKKKGSGSTRR